MNLPRSLRMLARRTKTAVAGTDGFGSTAEYWENRYRRGGNSGSGSSGRLAKFKAATLNDFVSANNVQSVIEFGSGDGEILQLTRFPKYTGVDLSPSIIESTKRRFEHVPTMRFIHTSELTVEDHAELALSLDVIYHLVEDRVFEDYMQQLFDAATRFVIIYSSDVDRPNAARHVRERNFTRWINANQRSFRLLRKIENPYPYSEKEPDETTWSDFYIFERIHDATKFNR